jgi:hypothetical protein
MRNYSKYFKSLPNPVYRVVALGELYLPSGRIFCCDPFLSEEVNALQTTVPPGRYQVQLSIATSPEWGPRVALAGLMFSTHEPVSWREAEYRIDDQGSSSFRVDAGLGCFMDQETRELLTRVVNEFYEKNPEGNYYDDILAGEFKQNAEPGSPRQSGDWAMHHPVNGDPRNIAMFASGLGDGVYPAYWGMHEMVQPAMLVADFQILPEQNKPDVAYRLRSTN